MLGNPLVPSVKVLTGISPPLGSTPDTSLVHAAVGTSFADQVVAAAL